MRFKYYSHIQSMSIEIEQKGYFATIQQFQFIRDIGVGSFGKVKLATHFATKRQYAVKVIDLRSNLTPTEKLMLTRQIKIHSKMNHPHIIKLWDTLVENDKIYLIMDYAKNGSLFRYYSKFIEKNIKPSPSQIYQFFYQTLDAIKYMHSLDIMHRDVKPQNLLLDEDFNIKICDFGWATSQISMGRTTFCGTYQYMAPQMVLQKSYDYRIDIWALGILLFQLNHRKAPFEAENLKIIKQKIIIGCYYIDNSCCPELRDLIINILQYSPENRLKIKQIQNHIWVKNCQKSKYGEEHAQQTKEAEKRKCNIYPAFHLQNNKFGQADTAIGIVKHEHQKSMGNFMLDSYKAYQINANEDRNKNANKQEQLKKHKRNITQPNEINQKWPFEKRLNTPITENVDVANKRLKMKCKTQAEEEVYKIEKYQKNFNSKKSLKNFEQAGKNRLKQKNLMINVTQPDSAGGQAYFNVNEKQNDANQRNIHTKGRQREKNGRKMRISEEKIAEISKSIGFQKNVNQKIIQKLKTLL